MINPSPKKVCQLKEVTNFQKKYLETTEKITKTNLTQINIHKIT